MLDSFVISKPRRVKPIHTQWFIWYESMSISRQANEDDPLTLSLVDEADLPDYLDEIHKSNLKLVSLQKAIGTPLMDS